MKRRMLSALLAMSMCFTLVNPVYAADKKTTADNVTKGYKNPWSNNAPAKLESAADENVDDVKFTHKEWTGETVGDVHNEDVFEVNREEASAFSTSSVIYDSVENARIGALDFKKEQSAYVQYLTGHENEEDEWSLKVVENPAEFETFKDFYQTDYDLSGWKTYPLPASWTAWGLDYPIYTNAIPPWQGKEVEIGNAGVANGEAKDLQAYFQNVMCPLAPVYYSPIGMYSRTFTVNDGLKSANGRIYLNFQGVESAYYVYLNGKEVGYSEDSYSPHSFDVTDYLVEGENKLSVEVHKFSDATYFELQDMYKDGGIFRDIYLYAAPMVQMTDYFATTDLDENYINAELNLNGVTVRNNSAEDVSGYKVDVRLYDEKGDVFVNDWQVEVGDIKAGESVSVDTSRVVYAPKLWSAEDPNLYTMVLSLYSGEGNFMGSMSQQLGFREIEFTSTQVDENGYRSTPDSEYKPITINGKPLLFKGVNRHDSDPVYGKYVSKEVMEEDITLMKQYNINALRTSHYSNEDYIYYLCNKYGLYMMGETNVEGHGIRYNASKQALFKEVVMDRTVTAFERLKNVSAIVSWSPGNENTYTSDKNYAEGMFYDLIWYFKDHDKTRPVHYEPSGDQNGTDMGSNMYPNHATVQNWSNRTMPYVMCEYAHAMGNAVSLVDYWNIVRSSDNMLGGFIWDWVDQSRRVPLESLSGGSYKMTEAKGLEADVQAEKVNLYPGSGALSEKSIVNGKANFGNVHNDALSGENKAFTVEVICKPQSISGRQALIAKGDKQVAMQTNGKTLEFYVYKYTNGGGGDWNTLRWTVDDNWLNNWHQVVGVYEAGKMKLYVDGVLQASNDNLTATIDASGKSLYIGFNEDKNAGFNGEISLGRIYTKALTEEEINGQRQESPAITSDSEDVLLWADFNNMKSESIYYDYYAEDYAHENLYDNAGYFYGFGGDHGEVNTNRAFCQNGMLLPDRTIQPELYEVKKQYQNFWFTADELQLMGEQVSVYNESSFDNLNEYDVTWTLMGDGKEIASGVVEDNDVKARETRVINVPYLKHMPAELGEGVEYYLNLSVALKEDTEWAKAGHEVAQEQFLVPSDVKQMAYEAASENVTIDESDANYIKVSGADNSFTFNVNKKTGIIENYYFGETLLLKKGPAPNYYRAPINNGGGGWNSTAGDSAVASSVTVGTNDKGLKTITVELTFPNVAGMKQSMTYTIENNGAVTFDTTVDATAVSNIERFVRMGTNMVLPAGFEQVDWYGNGPVESFSDRNTHSQVGLFNDTVSGLFFPYMNGGDTGTLTGVKWMTVTGDAPVAMAIAAKNPLEMSALHFTAQGLNVDHPYKMKPLEDTIVSVNYGSQGTGNGSVMVGPLPQYMIYNDKAYTYTYTLVPYATGEADVMNVTRPYRIASAISGEEAVKEKVDELIAAIDGMVVTKGSQAEELQGMLDKYNNLPQVGKDLVGKERYEKMVKDLELAEGIANDTVDAMIDDLGQNNYDINISDKESADIKKNADEMFMKGHFPVNNAGAKENFDAMFEGNNSFTIEAYIRPIDTGNSIIMSKGDHETTFRMKNGRLNFFIYNNGWYELAGNTVFTGEAAKQWHKVSAVYDGQTEGGTLSLYVDDVLDGRKTNVGGMNPNAAGDDNFHAYDLGIGNDYWKPHAFAGDMNYIHLYRAALTPEEMAAADADKLQREDIALWYDFSKVDYKYAVTEEVDKTWLAELIDYAESQKVHEDYQYVIPVVKEAFEAALAEALAVNERAEATQLQVDAAFDKLLEMTHYLGFTGNSESLRLLVKEAQGLNEKLYTEETWAVLKDTLAKADEVLANENALQKEIDAARDALQAAMDGLVKKPVDKTKLQKLVDKSKKYEDKIAEYTPATGEIFTGALANAKAIIESEEVTQEEIDAAYTALQQAIFGLRLIPNKDKLGDLINGAKEVDVTQYTVESAAAFQDALAKAEFVFADENATEDQVKAAEKALKKAQKNLVAKADADAEKDNDAEADKDADKKNDDKVASADKAAKTGDAGTAVPAAVAGIAALAVVMALKKRR